MTPPDLPPSHQAVVAAIRDARVPSATDATYLVRRGVIADAELIAAGHERATLEELAEGKWALIVRWQPPKGGLYWCLTPLGASRAHLRLDEHWEQVAADIAEDRLPNRKTRKDRHGRPLPPRMVRVRRPVEREHWQDVNAPLPANVTPAHAYEVPLLWAESIPDPAADPVEALLAGEDWTRDPATGEVVRVDSVTGETIRLFGAKAVTVAAAVPQRARKRAKGQQPAKETRKQRRARGERKAG